MTATTPTEQRPEFTLTPDEALARLGVEVKACLLYTSDAADEYNPV